jgi:hypothetical protein
MAMLPAPLIPNAANWIDAYDAGYGRGDELRKRNLLLEAGRLMAGGGSVAPTAAPSAAAQDQVGSLGSRFRNAESGGRVDAKNPNSSAFGPDQFTNGTWLDVLKRHRPDIAAGKSDAELLALRTNADLSGQMRDAYTSENQNALRAAGLPVTDGTSYLSYFAGPGGAKSVLSANPAAPVSQLLSPAAIRANPFLQNMSAGDLRAWADKKMGGGQAAAPSMPAAGASPAGMNAAANALLRGGELQAGMALQDKMRTQSREEEERGLARQKEMWGIIGDLALAADTPEKWARAIETAQRGGLNVQGMEDFSARDLVLARSGRMKDALSAAKPDVIAIGKRAFNKTAMKYVDDPASGADNVSDGAGELEKGMRWRTKGGKLELDETGRPIAEPIPGSPREAVSAEVAARVGLSEKFQKDVPVLEQEIRAGGLGGADFYLKRGKAGDILRRIEDGSEALVRNLTGAGMNLQEAQSYAERFIPGRLDTEATIIAKLKNLDANLKAVQRRVLVGRGAANIDQAAPQAPSPPQAAPAATGVRPRATNLETGEVVEYNEASGQWEPAQ